MKKKERKDAFVPASRCACLCTCVSACVLVASHERGGLGQAARENHLPPSRRVSLANPFPPYVTHPILPIYQRSPDGLVVVCKDEFILRVVEELVRRVLLLELLLELMQAAVEPTESVDRLLVLTAHLHVVVLALRGGWGAHGGAWEERAVLDIACDADSAAYSHADPVEGDGIARTMDRRLSVCWAVAPQ